MLTLKEILTCLYCVGYFALASGLAWAGWREPVRAPVETLPRPHRGGLDTLRSQKDEQRWADEGGRTP